VEDHTDPVKLRVDTLVPQHEAAINYLGEEILLDTLFEKSIVVDQNRRTLLRR
jgi:hypothetical protein